MFIQVLLPLVNVPMLDYSIEFLAGGGVEEIHVFARSHVRPMAYGSHLTCLMQCDQVQEHLSQSKFARMETLKVPYDEPVPYQSSYDH